MSSGIPFINLIFSSKNRLSFSTIHFSHQVLYIPEIKTGQMLLMDLEWCLRDILVDSLD